LVDQVLVDQVLVDQVLADLVLVGLGQVDWERGTTAQVRSAVGAGRQTVGQVATLRHHCKSDNRLVVPPSMNLFETHFGSEDS